MAILHQAITQTNADTIRSGDYALFQSQLPGSLVRWGTEWPKFDSVIH